MSRDLRVNCYVRVKATGEVGRINGIHRPGREDNDRRVLYGIAYGDEYTFGELERISPDQYHSTSHELRLSDRA
jgi:hypothetical protein